MKRREFKFYLETETFYTIFEALASIMWGINFILFSVVEKHNLPFYMHDLPFYNISLGLILVALGPLICVDHRKGVHTLLGGIVMWGCVFFHLLFWLTFVKKLYPIFIILFEIILGVLLIYLSFKKTRRKH